MAERCTATTKAGNPCSAQAWRGGLCRWHSPDGEEERAAWRRKGGVGKGAKVRARKVAAALTGDDLQGYLAEALTGVLAATYSPGQANAVAALSRAIVAVKEATEIEDRLSALEAAAGTTKGWTG